MKIKFDEAQVTEGYDWTSPVGILIPENDSDEYLIKKEFGEGNAVRLYTEKQLRDKVEQVKTANDLKKSEEEARKLSKQEPVSEDPEDNTL